MACDVLLTTDKDEIVAFLRRDPVYAAYALGDLEPALFPACTWRLARVSGETRALALLYTGLRPPVLLTLGEPAAVRAIFEQTALPAEVYMSALVEHLPIFQARYDFAGDRVRPMLRMVVTAQSFCAATGSLSPHLGPLSTGEGGREVYLRRLSRRDLPALRALYAQGGPFVPDAFSATQLRDGVFYGLETGSASTARGGRELIAVAGTHLVACAMGVAAVGNIYTHPAHRNRGYGRLVTAAVTAELLSQGLLVVLNVDQANTAAIHMYQELGYCVHGPFVEGSGAMRNE